MKRMNAEDVYELFNTADSIEIPRAFFESPYREMSVKAKILYGMLLDRLKTDSRTGNAKRDAKGAAYIKFPGKEAEQLLGIGNSTVTKLWKELESADLITRKKCGMGNPDNIYLTDKPWMDKAWM